jgi:GNAT superfamily N-acetyltransferase
VGSKIFLKLKVARQFIVGEKWLQTETIHCREKKGCKRKMKDICDDNLNFMSLSNFDRLVKLAEEVFAVRSDPSQLNVDQDVIGRLLRLHPSTLSEERDAGGPVAWLLLIPTTMTLMNRFLADEINERELFDLTPEDIPYEAIYLCSGLVLEEYRRKGITKKLALEAIAAIRKDHPIRALFSWAFTKEGDRVAEKIAELTGLPLYKKGGGKNVNP